MYNNQDSMMMKTNEILRHLLLTLSVVGLTTTAVFAQNRPQARPDRPPVERGEYMPQGDKMMRGQQPGRMQPGNPPGQGRQIQEREYRHRDMSKRPVQRWMETLTEEQREKMKEIRLSAQENVLALENQIRERKSRLNTLSTGETIDAKAAHSTIEEISNLESDLQKLRWNSRMEIRKLLTNEQKVLFDTFHSQNHRGPQRRNG